MKFLSKLGQILLKGTQLVTGLGPLLPSQYQGAVAKTKDTLEEAAQAIVYAEAFGQALSVPGADKLKAVTPVIAQILLRSDLLTGKKIDNPELFKTGSTKIADGLADILNSLKDDIDAESRTS